MTDIGLAAFSVFFMQSPSFLAHQTALTEGVGRGRSNAHTLFRMTAIPCDNHIRSMLDGAPPDHFDPVFAAIVKDFHGCGCLAPLRCLGGRVLIALDGSEHFCSRKVSCPHCSTRKRADGETEYSHSFVGATLVAPGHKTVLHGQCWNGGATYPPHGGCGGNLPVMMVRSRLCQDANR